MSIEKMREEFEAWVLERAKETPMQVYPALLERYEDDPRDYRQTWVDSAWQGWQASRTALVIELPPTPPVPEDPEEAIDDSHMDAYHSAVGMRHACLKFIEAAGVKVKP